MQSIICVVTSYEDLIMKKKKNKWKAHHAQGVQPGGQMGMLSPWKLFKYRLLEDTTLLLSKVS